MGLGDAHAATHQANPSASTSARRSSLMMSYLHIVRSFEQRTKEHANRSNQQYFLIFKFNPYTRTKTFCGREGRNVCLNEHNTCAATRNNGVTSTIVENYFFYATSGDILLFEYFGEVFSIFKIKKIIDQTL